MRGLIFRVDLARKSSSYFRCDEIGFGVTEMGRRPPREVKTLVDETGSFYRMTTERRPEASYGRPFMTIFPEALLQLADVKKPRAVLPVLVWCWKFLDHRNFRVIRQADIAAQIGTSVASVSEALAHLLQAGQIERTGSGPRQAWRLTTESSWKGTAGSYQQARRESAKAGPFRVIEGGSAAPEDEDAE